MAAIGEMVDFGRALHLSLSSQPRVAWLYLCTFSADADIRARIQGFGAAGIKSRNGVPARFSYPSEMVGRGLGLNALVASAGRVIGRSFIGSPRP